MKRLLWVAGLPVMVGALATVAPAEDVGQLFGRHCAACHGEARLGGSGPALLPESLERLPKPEARQVIQAGRVATQMPGFAGKLSELEMDQLVQWIYSPMTVPPRWESADIRASHRRLIPGALPATPVFKADPLNLFLVVETGDHHVSVLDGDTWEVIDRFKTPYALHGGPKFSPDGRFVYLASRDGWIVAYDLYNLKMVAEVRAGINTRNVAVSGDGRYLMVGNTLPATLVVLDAHDLSLVKVIPVRSAQGKPSRVSAVYQAEPRNSFVVALKDAAEIWEIPYQAQTKGWVHDYGPDSGEHTAVPTFSVRRIQVDQILDDFFFDQTYRFVVGADRKGEAGQAVDLELGKTVARLKLSGMPHLGSGITWNYQGRPVFATPNLKEGRVTVIDWQSFQVIQEIDTLGPGFFMRSHERTPYAWVDVFSGPERDAMHVIDKATLKVVATLRPEPGKTSGHVEFTRDGRFALVSIWEMDGWVVIYDAATLREVKRLPMRKPSGKYNVFNKITRSMGTSH